MKALRFTILLIAGLFMLGITALNNAAFAEEKSADEVAKELSSPAGSLASLSFNLQYTEFTGDLPGSDNEESTAVIFQPVFPFPVGDKGRRIIFRPAFTAPFDQPVFDADKGDFDDADVNLADTGFDLVYAGTRMTSKADSDEAWTVPLGFGVAKTTKIGSSPWKFAFQVQKYVVQPDTFGPDWLVKFTITPVIKNPFIF